MRSFLPAALGYGPGEADDYIHRLYYGDPATGGFLDEYARLLKANRKTGFFDDQALRRVLAEHLKELRRQGRITRSMLLRGVCIIGAGAFLYEQRLTGRLREEEARLIREARDIFDDGNDEGQH